MRPICAFLLFPLLASAGPKEDERDVAAVLKAQEDGWNKGDLEAYMAGYWKSPDLTFVSGGTVTKGWEQTLERYRKRYKGDGKEMGTVTFRDVETTMESDKLAIVRGRWELKFKNAKEKPGGRFTLLVRKLPEGWRVTYDHTSSDEK